MEDPQHCFKGNKSLRRHKLKKIRFFKKFLLAVGRIWIRSRIGTCNYESRFGSEPVITNPDSDPTDPDHCLKPQGIRAYLTAMSMSPETQNMKLKRNMVYFTQEEMYVNPLGIRLLALTPALLHFKIYKVKRKN
jgi:hypothetical protein